MLAEIVDTTMVLIFTATDILYQMVTQNICLIQVKKPRLLLTCAPISELPCNLSSMDTTKMFKKIMAVNNCPGGSPEWFPLGPWDIFSRNFNANTYVRY